LCGVVLHRLKLNSLIKNPASFEIRAVIWFLNATILTAAEIHQQLCGVYGPSVMSEGKFGSESGNSKMAHA